MSPGSPQVYVLIRSEGDSRHIAVARLEEMRSSLPNVRIDVVTVVRPNSSPTLVVGPDDDNAMLEAVQEGAMGYVIDHATKSEYSAAVAAVAQGKAVIPPMMLGALLRDAVRRRRIVAESEKRLSALTERERQVVDLLARGHQRREIADALFISPETVRTHIQRAMTKLDVHSQNELVALIAGFERGDL